ncbi:hypothetical protein EK0264_03235 [Epidermidibacterium keratini]|uniref:Uncharacterized protein n=1 Tax=Epidermidibacterium keratini TaxID=1891644 RepID=A0A7L4YJB5_9ACTN|nr:hypothetical protein [Epidermidibacterium keratini]QHB99390.1 hypothetical protein EK0264_03235 [Epidermidibacterium keratini]
MGEASGRPRPRKRRSAYPPGSEDAAARGLVFNVRTQLRRDQVMRARDINRPSQDDLAEAEAEVQIVRRHWRPRD